MLLQWMALAQQQRAVDQSKQLIATPWHPSTQCEGPLTLLYSTAQEPVHRSQCMRTLLTVHKHS
jgi:hypothetical protein